jgi:FtsZ-binding cell division protein ZapB
MEVNDCAALIEELTQTAHELVAEAGRLQEAADELMAEAERLRAYSRRIQERRRSRDLRLCQPHDSVRRPITPSPSS